MGELHEEAGDRGDDTQQQCLIARSDGVKAEALIYTVTSLATSPTSLKCHGHKVHFKEQSITKNIE